jgi:NADPH:quinone reductase
MLAEHAAGLRLQSTFKRAGVVELTLSPVTTPKPQADEVVVRVEAAPINPSDLMVLFGPADMSTVRMSGTSAFPVVIADVPPRALDALSKAGRLDQPTGAGNEGAGVVVEAGESGAAQALVGRSVAIFGEPTYSQFRCVKAEECLILPEGIAPSEGASSFVNPLTALGMLETLRAEGHTALVHSAAASNLGQILVKLCQVDGIELVNIVRTREQENLLRSLGALYIVNSSSPSFTNDLTAAIGATGATLAFDATGGGTLAGQILKAMEIALSRKSQRQLTGYGTAFHKQVYIYGGLDPAPTELRLNFGMAWGISGWLLFNFIEEIGPKAARTLKERVASEIRTTFASSYTRTVSLRQALQPEEIAVYGKRATGQKYLINPSKDI